VTIRKTAATRVPVHPLLAERWSPRGFDAQHEVRPDQLTALLEAARWAPSANNSQPWRFVVTQRGTTEFDHLTELLAPGNQVWAANAGALVLVAAQLVDDAGRPLSFALYDTGQAVAHLVTQAQAEGLATHQMGGFDTAGVSGLLGLGPDVTPVVVVAVGRFDNAAELAEPLATRERAPRSRRPLDDLLLPVDASVRLVA
jgi:nitroreductase